MLFGAEAKIMKVPTNGLAEYKVMGDSRLHSALRHAYLTKEPNKLYITFGRKLSL